MPSFFDVIFQSYMDDLFDEEESAHWMQNDFIRLLNHGKYLVDGRHARTTDEEWSLIGLLLETQCNEHELFVLWNLVERTRPDWPVYLACGKFA